LITKKRRDRPKLRRRSKGMIAIHTLGETMRRKHLSVEEAAKECVRICGEEHQEKGIDCFREIHGHPLCARCQKYPRLQKRSVVEEWRTS